MQGNGSIQKKELVTLKVQPLEVDWSEISCLMEVATILYLNILRFYFVRQIRKNSPFCPISKWFSWG